MKISGSNSTVGCEDREYVVSGTRQAYTIMLPYPVLDKLDEATDLQFCNDW